MQQGRLASEFTARLYREFKLNAAVFEDMSEPEDSKTDDELAECLAHVHDEKNHS